MEVEPAAVVVVMVVAAAMAAVAAVAVIQLTQSFAGRKQVLISSPSRRVSSPCTQPQSKNRHGNDRHNVMHLHKSSTQHRLLMAGRGRLP